MKILFYLIVIIGLCYFLLKNRKFDFFTIGFLSAVVYFLPGFYGYAYYNMSLDIRSYLADETYLIMITLLILILIGALLFDLKSNDNVTRKTLQGTEKVTEITTLIAIISFILTIYTIGWDTLTQLDKRTMLEELNIWHSMMRASTALAVVLSFNSKKWRLFVISLVILLFNTYIGFRSTTAYTVIALFMIYLSDKGKQRLLLNNIKVLIIGVMAAVFFFSYKSVYILVKAGEYGEALATFFSIDNLIYSISHSEPFTTQAILNEVIITNFKSGYDHLIEVFIDLIIPVGKSTLAGQHIGVTNFTDLISTNVFKDRTNIASNIWAELWSAGGWILLITSMVLFVLILFISSRLLFKTKNEIQSGIALIISIWAFYIHRNTVSYQLELSREFIAIFIISMLISLFIMKKPSKIRRKSLRSSN
ncbi:hypothetical protein [Oceanobacillus sp. AG]|uniref:hypothetical protein n=1 Tax=Oceanobacillus sp. AG TaxID=2681969 RepID=UPI0012EBEFAB|nr:hypothetical protein [Oceanobacillus sp. AG]